MHNTALAYSLMTGNPKFLEIQYWLIRGVMAFSHQVLFIIICKYVLKYSLRDYRAILGSWPCGRTMSKQHSPHF